MQPRLKTTAEDTVSVRPGDSDSFVPFLHYLQKYAEHIFLKSNEFVGLADADYYIQNG